MRKTPSEVEQDLDEAKQFRRPRRRSSLRFSESISYPKAVVFIVGNEFCERFTFYGTTTILAGYLKNSLHLSDSSATVTYHVFVMLCYFFPLMGAIIADSWFGKYSTILYLSLVYLTGDCVVIVSAIPGVPAAILTLGGLFLIAVGAGGIKPCVSAFGGDQFTLPEQESHLKKFFSIFYFTINAGSFISSAVTPLLREINCLGEQTCYSLAFGVPTILMLTSIAFFVGGTTFYIRKKPERNIILKVLRCIGHALRKTARRRRRRRRKTGHWLDRAADKYDPAFIEEVKHTLRLLVMYIPLPFFWALFDQQGSRWTFQASRMNGDIASTKLHPDQMQILNPILILVFIPLFEAFVYPPLARYNLLKKPLQRLTCGGLIAALAFVVSAVVEYKLEETYAVLPKPNEGQIRVYNGLPEILNIEFIDPFYDPQSIPILDFWRKYDVPAKGEAQVKIRYVVKGTEQTETLTVFENALTSYVITPDKVVQIANDDPNKSDEGYPKVMIIYSSPNKSSQVLVRGCSNEIAFTITQENPYTEYVEMADCDVNEILVNDEVVVHKVKLGQGGVYVVLILDSEGKTTGNFLTVVQPNSVHMLWLVPQYVLITAAEVMFSITGLEFSFTQAPVSMKTLLQATWLLTIAVGNLIVAVVAQTKIFERQLYEFLLFAGLMTLDMIIFAIMALYYTYAPIPSTEVTPEQSDPGRRNR